MAADDYISRKEAIKTVVSYKWNFCPKNMRDWATKLKSAVCSDICSDLAKLPASNVRQNVPAKWIPSALGTYFTCSNCQAIYSTSRTTRTYERRYEEDETCGFNFCPNCGADMRRMKNDRNP